MSDSRKKRDKLSKFMTEMYEVKTRSDIWDFAYATEYDCESQELNELMAGMTDAEVFAWFPGMCAEYIAAKLEI